ncbi:MAG TPA: carbon-nitrogen hydrolase family protein [Thermomicrobiaceae bacterium]|nr:carbon-nitrogen hydrolase family protein [Thermomicrobiaceae bacterium]
MRELTVALLQLTACGTDQDANRAKGIAACRQARAIGADVALFPEMWNVGYPPLEERSADGCNIWRAPGRWRPGDTPVSAVDPAARERWQSRAIEREGDFVGSFRGLARELDMAIALTYLERWEVAPRNTVSLIDRHGEPALTYAKVHTCDFDEPESSLTPGDGFAVCDLDTRDGPVKVGAMICYDREFPESARVLMLLGAELILTPNACPLDAVRLAQFRTRAHENMVGVAMSNYAAPQQNGHSVAYHPIAYHQDGRQRDTLVVEAGEREGIYPALFDLDELRDYRERETWGNAFRRPHRYGRLTSPEVAPPFVRVDAEGRPYDPSRR